MSESDTVSNAASNPQTFTIDQLRDAKMHLDKRKAALSLELIKQGYVSAKLHDNYYRDAKTHYPQTGDPDLPEAEIQFLSCLFIDAEQMKEGARVVIMRRYQDSAAFVYRLTRQPYARLPENWLARFEKQVCIDLPG